MKAIVLVRLEVDKAIDPAHAVEVVRGYLEDAEGTHIENPNGDAGRMLVLLNRVLDVKIGATDEEVRRELRVLRGERRPEGGD